MSTCRCTATKHATARLALLDDKVREEIGWGEEFDGARFNRFMDGFRTVFYLRKGLSLSGHSSLSSLHAAELEGTMGYEEFSSLSDVAAAVVLYRARRAREER
jgi:hypothetical protein